jgi:hypothetical protein
MKITKEILTETTKTRTTAERSTSAADQSASAAVQSVHIVRQQIEGQAGLGRVIVETTIDSAMNAINHRTSQDLGQYGVQVFFGFSRVVSQ